MAYDSSNVFNQQVRPAQSRGIPSNEAYLRMLQQAGQNQQHISEESGANAAASERAIGDINAGAVTGAVQGLDNGMQMAQRHEKAKQDALMSEENLAGQKNQNQLAGINLQNAQADQAYLSEEVQPGMTRRQQQADQKSRMNEAQIAQLEQGKYATQTDAQGNVYRVNPQAGTMERIGHVSVKDPKANLNDSLTPGQKKLDTDFAQEYSSYYAQGGKATVDKNLTKLENIKKRLETEPGISGGASNSLPDGVQAYVNPKAIEVQDAITDVVQQTVKQLFPGAISDKETERVVKAAYNPRLKQEENAKRVGAIINELKNKAMAKEAAGQHFQQHGTLQGFNAIGSMPPAESYAGNNPPPPVPPPPHPGMVTIQAPDGTTMNVPVMSVPKYVQKGGKVVGGEQQANAH
jgi:hypothetical protein